MKSCLKMIYLVGLLSLCNSCSCTSPKSVEGELIATTTPWNFRATPVSLRSDALVTDFANGNPPLRLSWISYESDPSRPKNITINGTVYPWDRDKPFACGWSNFHFQTVQVKAKLGNNVVSIDGMPSWNVYYPQLGEVTGIAAIGDPQILEDNRFGLLNAHRVLNTSLNKHMDSFSTVVFGGDNFYDPDNGNFTAKFWQGQQAQANLNPNFYSKLLVAVMGNHDYSLDGGRNPTGGKGRQHLQWYAMDGHQTPFANNDPIDCGNSYLPTEWTSGYYAIGGYGFLTGDNSRVLDLNSPSAPKYADVAARFSKLNVTQVYYVSHWLVPGPGGVETTIDVANKISHFFTDKGMKFNWISNHTHLNQDKGNGNRLTGGNGHTADCPPGASPTGTCIGANCCCPSYLKVDKTWQQGWNAGGACDPADFR